MRQKLENKFNSQPKLIGQDDQINAKTSVSDYADSDYKSKVNRLKKRIIFNLSTFGFFVVFMFVTYLFGQNAINENENDIRNLNARISDLTNKSVDIESRISEVQRYNKVWINADEKRKNPGKIKISDINDQFNVAVEKYNLSSYKISIAPPETLKEGLYDNNNFEVQLVNCTIEFQSLTDRIAMTFVDNFLKSIPGYVIINNLEIKKNKKEALSFEDLMAIKSGTNLGLVSSRVVFSWYFLKDKLQVAKQ